MGFSVESGKYTVKFDNGRKSKSIPYSVTQNTKVKLRECSDFGTRTAMVVHDWDAKDYVLEITRPGTWQRVLKVQVARRCFVIPSGTLAVLASDRTGHTVANPAECILGKIIRWVEDWKVDSRGVSNDESYYKVELVPGTIIQVPMKDVHV